LELRDNESIVIRSASGRLLDPDVHHNGTNSDFWDFEATGIKAIEEPETARSFVHDNGVSGVWCDAGCDFVPSMQNGWWVHHNLVVVNNRRWGVRYEHSPKGLLDGQTVASSKALIECNLVANNGADARGGVSFHDAQNGTVRANAFGPMTVAGVSYAGNRGGRRVRVGEDAVGQDGPVEREGRGQRLKRRAHKRVRMTDTSLTPGGQIVDASDAI